MLIGTKKNVSDVFMNYYMRRNGCGSCVRCRYHEIDRNFTYEAISRKKIPSTRIVDPVTIEKLRHHMDEQKFWPIPVTIESHDLLTYHYKDGEAFTLKATLPAYDNIKFNHLYCNVYEIQYEKSCTYRGYGQICHEPFILRDSTLFDV